MRIFFCIGNSGVSHTGDTPKTPTPTQTHNLNPTSPAALSAHTSSSPHPLSPLHRQAAFGIINNPIFNGKFYPAFTDPFIVFLTSYIFLDKQFFFNEL
jgi:hypothetical protein